MNSTQRKPLFPKPPVKETMPLILWLACLPKEEFDRAMKAVTEQGRINYNSDFIATSLAGSLACAFAWHMTDEGHLYWYKLYVQLCEAGL
jgi:hypothetical protein